MSLESSLELNVIRAQMREYCAFSLGMEEMDSQRPSYDPLIIRRDRGRMQEALACTVHYGPMPFYGVRDLRAVLKNAEKGRVLSAQDLVQDIQLIRGMKAVRSYEQGLTEVPHEDLKELTDAVIVHDRVLKKLESCINDYGEVFDNASPLLRKLRADLKRADAEIAGAAQHFLAAHPASIVDGILTTRNGRAVVLVKATEKNSFGGLVYGDSASGQASYIEPPAFVQANNRKQELMEQEKEEVERILAECSQEVGATAGEQTANLETCAILDCFFAKAQWGRAHNAIVADLNSGREIHLIKARHPLIDPLKVVANDYHIAPPHTTLLITGPNTGGKTVSLKVIGLFVLMTYCGMPVTADSASIPFFDHVYADIGDDQSVVSSLSSFSAHIQKQAETANHATGMSLALLDEIGSGTDPREGESLAIALLNELRERGTMTIATTHYGRLKAYGKRHADILVASVQFDMEKLMPTYRYVEGLSGSSNAFEVAQRYGLPEPIIRYARFLKDQAKTQEDELIEKLEKQLSETELLKEKLQAEVKQNQDLQVQLSREKNDLELNRDKLMAKAQKEAEQYAEAAARKADAILSDMREKQETAKYHEVLAIRQQLKQDPQEMPEEPALADDRPFAVSDTVELRASSQLARVTKIGRRDITILLNGREIRVRPDQIRHTSRQLPKVKKASASVSFETGLAASSPLECNLIGMHVDEAVQALGDYLADVRLHHLKTCRIIHGDGTGALRKAVWNYLKNEKGIDSYRIGMPQEGGTGATVVVFKD
jgi:DNA mismatch repair protein MutS2